MKKIFLFLIALLVIGSLIMIKSPIPLETLKEKYANEHSNWVDIDGLQVHYRIEGEGEPVVLIHGTGASLQTFDDWTEIMKNKYQIIRMDIPAFGLTGPNLNNDYTIDAYVKFIQAFTEKLELKNFILGGNSLGGEIAWKYAYYHPENVKGLVLLNPAGSPVRKFDMPFFSAFNLAKVPVISSLFGYFDPKFTVEKTVKQAYEKDELVTPEIIEMYYELSLREGNRAAFVARIQQLDNDPILSPEKVEIPTLIIWGKQDAILLIEQLEGFKDMKNMKSIVYDGVGHTPHDEVAQESAAATVDFIESLNSSQDSTSNP